MHPVRPLAIPPLSRVGAMLGFWCMDITTPVATIICRRASLMGPNHQLPAFRVAPRGWPSVSEMCAATAYHADCGTPSADGEGGFAVLAQALTPAKQTEAYSGMRFQATSLAHVRLRRSQQSSWIHTPDNPPFQLSFGFLVRNRAGRLRARRPSQCKTRSNTTPTSPSYSSTTFCRQVAGQPGSACDM